MESLWEKIKQFNGFQLIPPRDQKAQITSQSRRAATRIMNSAGLERGNEFKSVEIHSGAGRIHHHKVGYGAGKPPEKIKRRFRHRANILEGMGFRIRRKVCGRRRVGFNGQHLIELPRQGKRQQANTGKKVKRQRSSFSLGCRFHEFRK